MTCNQEVIKFTYKAIKEICRNPHNIAIFFDNLPLVSLFLKKTKTRQSWRYAENPRDTAVFRGLRPSREFFRQDKKHVLDEVNASMCVKHQVCIVFRLARRRDRNKYIHKFTNIQVKLGISSTSCSPHVDFENSNAIIEQEK